MAEQTNLSFIVPVYNAGRFLLPCIESLLAQTCPDYEVILVDDGSTDGSAAQCDVFAGDNAAVRVLHQKNAGVSAARNAGMAAAKGRWLAFVDADDWVSPQYAALVKRYGQNAQDLLLFNYADALPDKIIEHRSAGEVRTLDAAALLDVRRATLNRYHRGVLDYLSVHMTGVWMKAYRRETVQQAALCFPAGILSGEDTYFNFRFLAAARSGVFIPEIIYYYRKNPASVTQRYNPLLWENFLRVDALYRDYFAANPAEQARFAADYNLYLASCCMFIALQDCCHPQNPHPYRQRRAAFLRLCGQTPFAAGLAKAELRQFSWKKALVCRLLRCRAFLALTLLGRIGGTR